MNISKHKARFFLVYNFEAIIWVSVILYFAFSPVQSSSHFTICPLSLAGFEHCPGCGLGHSLILLLHGQIKESFNMHPLGVFALAVITARTIIIFYKYKQFQNQINSLN